MYYNIVTKPFGASNHIYNLVLVESEVVRFAKAYEKGLGSARINGIKMQINNLHVIKIFTITPFLLPLSSSQIKNEIMKDSARTPLKKTSIAVLRRFGEDVTSQFINCEWGEKQEIGDSVKSEIACFVNLSRIAELKNIKSVDYDLTKLLKLCEEINVAFKGGNYYSTGALCRAVLDHVPPVFGCKNFNEVANNYKSPGSVRSFSESIKHLNDSMRKISDKYLHSQITKKEILPNETQIDCKRDLDILLEEVIKVLIKK
jgi:hypothetical protein